MRTQAARTAPPFQNCAGMASKGALAGRPDECGAHQPTRDGWNIYCVLYVRSRYLKNAHGGGRGGKVPVEAREQLGFEPLNGQDDVRVPANIAGSAANPDEGGRPTEEEED